MVSKVALGIMEQEEKVTGRLESFIKFVLYYGATRQGQGIPHMTISKDGQIYEHSSDISHAIEGAVKGKTRVELENILDKYFRAHNNYTPEEWKIEVKNRIKGYV